MIVGVNKCNITKLAIEELNKLYWGFRCKDSRAIFLENYAQYLGCPTVNLVTCYPDNCLNPTIVSVCNISIAKISYLVNGNTFTFFVDAPDLTGATPPLLYGWTYDTDAFDLVGIDANTPTLVLTLKDGVVLDDLVTGIAVVIRDTNNCTASKTCYLVAGSTVCTDGYIPCPNAIDLVVSASSIPFFNIIANGLQHISTSNSMTITSTGSYSINWGDGTVDDFTAGTSHPTHVYDSPYTGYIRISSNSLDLITTFILGTSLADIIPSTGALTVLTSELEKLENLVTLSLGSQVFLDGVLIELPRTLTLLGSASTNLSGDTGDLPATLLTISVTGANTISGNVSSLPTGLTSLLIWGLNTISGNVAGLPINLTALNVHGFNTISGSPIGLPSGLLLTDLLGNNTMSGDIAGWPSVSIQIVVLGNNTLFGNIANLPSGLQGLTILGNNTISGSLSGIPSGVIFFQVTGNNTISGNLALIPAGITLINIISTHSTINAYTPSIRTWHSIMNTVAIEVSGIGGGFDATEVDNILIELAAQVASWTGDKKVRLLGGSASRTAASDAAVATLTGLGVTVTTI